MASPSPDALLQLPVEIILGIVKQLDFQPGDIGSLLGSSKVGRFHFSSLRISAFIFSSLTYSLLL
jgi:hypothetical protein